jgi:nitronate monooxygenase
VISEKIRLSLIMLKELNIKLPIIQAPMAGAADSKLAIAVCKAGGLGSLACPTLSIDQIRKEVELFRKECPSSPLNLNFFCHKDLETNSEIDEKWKKTLTPYYEEYKLDPDLSVQGLSRKPFNEETCSLMEELKPEVISFHFGLPDPVLLKRVRKIACKIISTATTVTEAIWLEQNGCDAIIAQGLEAGGHRGMFLSEDISTQVGSFALIPRIVDSVRVPVIAAGGIADGRGMASALILGASAVQIGTAYLFTHEAKISILHQNALLSNRVDETALTNIFSGRPARGIMNKIMNDIGPMTNEAPPFPYAGFALAPLKAAAEKLGSDHFSSLWAGQAAGLLSEIISAEAFTKKIAQDANMFLTDNLKIK